MTDRAVSVGCVVAYLLWGLSVLLLLLTWAVFDDTFANRLGQTSLIMCGAAITATIRVYFVTQNRIIRSTQVLADEGVRLLQ